jgi:hypothetical protein
MSIDAVQAVFASAPAIADFAIARSASASTEAVPRASSNDALRNFPQARQLQVDASFGQANLIIYRILDKQTGDLILQVPPEQLLQIARSVQQLLQANKGGPSLDVRT